MVVNDTVAPTINISPAGVTTTSNITVSIDWCDEHTLNSASRRITLNGQPASGFSYTTSAAAGCGAHATSTGTLNLVPGTNELSAYICDNNSNCESQDAGYTLANYGVAVTPDNVSEVLGINRDATQLVTVRNNSNVTVSFSLTPHCTGAALTTTCTAARTSLTLGAGSSGTDTVRFRTAGSGGATGRVALVASGSGVTDSGWVNVNVPAEYSVSVTPRDSTKVVTASSAASQLFTVTNGGNLSTSFTFTTTCGGNLVIAGSCAVTPASTGLAPGASANVTVSFQTSTTGAGAVALHAKNTVAAGSPSQTQDSGWVAVALTAPLARVTLARAFPGTTVEKSACLHFSIRPGVGTECGVLRVAHALPAIQTLNKARVPTLLYYYDQAAGPQVIGVNVSRTATAVPDSVRTILYQRTGATYVELQRRSYAGAAWADTMPRRVAMTIDDVPGLSTRIVPYRVQVDFKYPGQAWTSAAPPADGEIAIVRREMGSGWHVGGVEALYLQPDSSILWVAGDGSTRKYVSQGIANGNRVFTTPSLDQPDTLLQSTTDRMYTREAGNGLRIIFDTVGLHRQTINRLGQATTFGYVTGTRKLDTITVAPTTAGVRYIFNYSGNGTLASVTSPGASGLRTTIITPGSVAGVIARITDPDGSHVDYEYSAASGGGQLMSACADRRGARTTFTAEASAPTLGADSTPAGTQIVSHLYRIASSIGAAPASAPTSLDSVYMRYDGPRADVADITKIWVGNFGTPVKVVDPTGATTTIAYDDPRFPLLATGETVNSGVLTRAWYNARGLIDSSTVYSPYGDGRNATTSYRWDATWPSVASTRLPEGETTSDSVDVATGNVLWDNVGGDTTKFHYNAGGLVDSVLTSDGAYDKYGYDNLGNLAWHRRPNGFVDSTFRDLIGRETQYSIYTENPKPNITKTWYDVAGNDSLTRTYRDVDTLEVRTLYNAEGQPVSVRQRALPARAMATDSTMIDTVTRTFAYDTLGRKVSEMASDALVDTWSYDVAGNLLSSRRETSGYVLTYDAANRLVHRSGGLDSATFTYDPVTGGLSSATNPSAVVTRTYYPNGSVKDDNAVIMPPRSLSELYETRASYDLDGRRTSLTLPEAAGGGAITRTFDPRTGQLATVTDPNGTTYRYHYDLRGNIDSLVRRANQSGPLVETRIYDGQSRLQERRVPGFRDDIYTYDALNRIDSTMNNVDVVGTATVYDGLGHVTSTNTAGSETFTYDALGNVVRHQMIGAHGAHSDVASSYEPASMRLAMTWDLGAMYPDTTWYSYNAGTLIETERHHWFVRSDPNVLADYHGYVLTTRTDYMGFGNKLVRSASFYDSVWTVADPHGNWRDSSFKTDISYGYDALGRRVWQRAIYGNGCPFFDGSQACSSSITTAVWDGNALLLEARTSADTGYQLAVGDMGTVVYVQGSELDKPLAVLGPQDLLPVTDWRGIITDGACPATRCSSGEVSFAQSYAGTFGAPGYPKLSPRYYGSLVQGQEDPTGYIYQRNRYLDPNTGRFTQEDPIGLAGGLNVYGYSGGDPVNYSDPFGLCPQTVDGIPCAGSTMLIGAGAGAAVGVLVAGTCAASSAGICTLAAPAIVGFFAAGGATVGGLIGTVMDMGGNSGKNAPGQTAGGRATDEYGNVLGPSGAPANHEVDHATKKAAKDAARKEGKGPPVNHPSPKRGKPHYHPTGPDGEKIPSSTHHNYPSDE